MILPLADAKWRHTTRYPGVLRGAFTKLRHLPYNGKVEYNFSDFQPIKIEHSTLLIIMLKTLFNIVEAPFNFFFKLWCLCCMMMFRWTNKQPGMQKFWNLCCHYQDIYHWINGQAYHLFLHSSIWGKMSEINLVIVMFTSLKHLMVLLRCNFFRASFLHLIKNTDSM